MKNPTLINDINLKNEVISSMINDNGNGLVEKYEKHFNNNTSFSLFIARFFFDHNFEELKKIAKMKGRNVGETQLYSIPKHVNIGFMFVNNDTIWAWVGIYTENDVEYTGTIDLSSKDDDLIINKFEEYSNYCREFFKEQKINHKLI